MAIIDEIREIFVRSEFVLSRHATDQAILRNIYMQEVSEAIRSGELIEDYPDDKYGPSCLILGFTKGGRPLHIQCTYPQSSGVRIVTLYEPNFEDWIDYRIRR